MDHATGTSSASRYATASIIVALLLLVGCGRNQGKQTFELLKAEHEIIQNMRSELKECSLPKKPTAPDASAKLTRVQRQNAEKSYHDEMGRYFLAVMQRYEQGEKIVNEAERQISKLDTAGVGDDVVRLTQDRERLCGDTVQYFVEMRALTGSKRSQWGQKDSGEALEFFLDVVGTAVQPEIGGGALLKTLSRAAERQDARKLEIQEDYAALRKAVETWERHRGVVVTKQSELVTSYRARYPKYDWNSVLSE